VLVFRRRRNLPIHNFRNRDIRLLLLGLALAGFSFAHALVCSAPFILKLCGHIGHNKNGLYAGHSRRI